MNFLLILLSVLSPHRHSTSARRNDCYKYASKKEKNLYTAAPKEAAMSLRAATLNERSTDAYINNSHYGRRRMAKRCGNFHSRWFIGSA